MIGSNPFVESYERGLESIAAKDRPSDYPGLTPETRAKAGYRQLEIYSYTGWPMWRYYKIRLINRLLDQRSDIVTDLEMVFPDLEERAISVAYQQVSNGLMGSAISEFCQCIEDFAALTRALGNISYFAKNLSSYRAGVIQNIIENWSGGVSLEEVSKLLYVPELDDAVFAENGSTRSMYRECRNLAHTSVEQAALMYVNFLPHFMAYKHGMSYALCPSGNDLGEDLIKKKLTDKCAFPVIFTNGSIVEALSEYNFRGGLQLPDIGPGSDHIRLNALKLSRERNLLRLVLLPPDTAGKAPSCDNLEDLSLWICRLQQVAVRNCLSRHSRDWPEGVFHNFELPNKRGRLSAFSSLACESG